MVKLMMSIVSALGFGEKPIHYMSLHAIALQFHFTGSKGPKSVLG